MMITLGQSDRGQTASSRKQQICCRRYYQRFFLLTLFLVAASPPTIWSAAEARTLTPDVGVVSPTRGRLGTAATSPAGGDEDRVLQQHHHHPPYTARAPAYMAELYEELSKSEGGLQGTIRSILPCNGRGRSVVEFCGNAGKTGELSRAELHIKTRRRRRKRGGTTTGGDPSGNSRQIQILAGNLTEYFRSTFNTFLHIRHEEAGGGGDGGEERIQLPLHNSRAPGWKTFDITEDLLTVNSAGDWKVDLSFESLEGEMVKPRSILRLTHTPFLVLFSDPAKDGVADFQKDFGSDDDDEEELQDLASASDQPDAAAGKRRFKRYVEITADLTENYSQHDNGQHGHLSNDIPTFVRTSQNPADSQMGHRHAARRHQHLAAADNKNRQKSAWKGKEKKRRRPNRPEPSDSGWENEVLNFGDESEEGGEEDGEEEMEDEEDNRIEYNNNHHHLGLGPQHVQDLEDEDEDELRLDYEEDDLTESEADAFRFEVTEGGGEDSNNLIPYPKGYRKSSAGRRRELAATGGGGGGGKKQPRQRGGGKESSAFMSSARRIKGGRRSRRRQKSGGGRRKGGGGAQSLPKIWKSFEKENYPVSGVLEEGVEGELCGLRNYSVDLRMVGFGRRIISPRHYSANYCRGECAFPLTQAESPTNHATILSILKFRHNNNNNNNSNSNSEPPAACCVPRKMDSLTLLYFDSDGSVVLKSYPQMSVQSCGCR